MKEQSNVSAKCYVNKNKYKAVLGQRGYGRLMAHSVPNVVSILLEYKGFFGDYADIAIPENDPRKLPKAIRLHGRVYGLSGHNTDLGKASYATGKVVAKLA